MDYEVLKKTIIKIFNNNLVKDTYKLIPFEDRINLIGSFWYVLGEDTDVSIAFENLRISNPDFSFNDWLGSLFTEEEATYLIDNNILEENKIPVIFLNIKSNDKKLNYFKKLKYTLGSDTVYELLLQIEDDDIRIQFIKDHELNMTQLLEIIKTFKDDNYKYQYLMKYKEDFYIDSIFAIFKSINNDETLIKTYNDISNYLSDELEDYMSSYTDFLNELINKTSDEAVIKIIDIFYNTNKNRIQLLFIINNVIEDRIKVRLIENYIELYSSDLLGEALCTINNDDSKLELFNKYVDLLNNDGIAKVIGSFNNNDLKINLFERYKDDFTEDEYSYVIRNIKNDKVKIKYLETEDLPDYPIISIIVSLQDLELMLEKYEEYDYLFNGIYFIDLLRGISSISNNGNFKKFLNFVKKYRKTEKDIIVDLVIKNKELITNSSYIKEIIKMVSNIEDKILFIDTFIDNLSSEDLQSIILSIESEEFRYELLKRYHHLLDENQIKIIINSYEAKELVYSSLEFLNIDTINSYSYVNLTKFYDVNINVDKEIKELVNEIASLLDDRDISISDLKALIGLQTRVNYENNRKLESYVFLPSDIAEQLSELAKNTSYKELLLNGTFIKKYNILTNLLRNSFDLDDITNYINTYSNKKDKNIDAFLIGLLNNVGIKSMYLGNMNRNELLNEFLKVLKEELINNNIDIENLYSYVDVSNLERKDEAYYDRALTINEIYIKCIKKVMGNAFKKENMVENGLLTQLCICCLNLEKNKWEQTNKASLESIVKSNLLLTDKGKELVYKRRVESIIKNDSDLKDVFENPNIKFNEKMNIVFSKLYPEYKGQKNLKTLYGLMISDERFKRLLSKPIDGSEKETIPFELANFMIDKSVQKEKLMCAIINAIGRGDIEYDVNRVDSRIIERLNVIKNNLISIKNDSKQNIPLLSFIALNVLSSDNLENLLLYYDCTKKYYMPTDKNGKPKELNIDNLYYFVTASNRLAVRNTKYYSVLGKEVIGNIEQLYMDDYYNLYVNYTSKRFYRTIPDVKGVFEKDEKKYRYESYDVSDSEQLIAGSRITAAVKTSCLKLGWSQANTLEYLVSSPNGIIIAIKDENNNFLGRVYGYRIGNAVHFTRFYYNKEFDFKTAMTKIANDIINNSNEIDYVTCIPFTSSVNRYLSDNIISKPSDICVTQEGNEIYTDLSTSYSEISVVASRHPITDLKNIRFNREEPKEKYYKKRKEPRTIVIDKNIDLNVDDSLNDVFKIIRCSNQDSNIIKYILEAKQVIYGEDWVIIDFGGREPVIINVNYGYDKESLLYTSVVINEINSALELLKVKQINPEDDSHTLGGL